MYALARGRYARPVRRFPVYITPEPRQRAYTAEEHKSRSIDLLLQRITPYGYGDGSNEDALARVELAFVAMRSVSERERERGLFLRKYIGVNAEARFARLESP